MWNDSLYLMQSNCDSQMFIFKPVFNWVLKYCKNYQHIKSLYILGYESFGRFSDRV